MTVIGIVEREAAWRRSGTAILVCDRLWTQARLATMAAGADAPYGAVEDGVVAARDGRILYAGPRSDAPGFDARRDDRLRRALDHARA